MSEYQVLARKWRPQRFEDLVGQDVVVRTLRNALESGEIAHAYLFSGLRGVGKTSVARLLAKALNCENGPTAEPCGSCVACEEIAAGSSMDVLELDAASNRGIEEVRQLREIAKILPVRDRYRVFILDEAHQLSRDAFNALLKILEEPPAHVVFILASTEKHKFPSTILSRCLQVDFRPISVELVAERLSDIAGAEGFELSRGAAELIARAGEGSLRDALSLLDRVRSFAHESIDEDAVAEVLGLPPTATVIALWDALADADVGRALELTRQEETAGHDPVALYDQVAHLVHVLMLLSCDPTAPIPFSESLRGDLVARAERAGTALLVRVARLALDQRGLIAVTDRPGMAVSVALGRLAQWPRLIRVEELLSGGAPVAGPPPAHGRSGGGGRPGGGGGGEGVRSEGHPPASRAISREAPSADDPKSRLVKALTEAGSPLLAGRIRKVQDAVVEDGVLRLVVAGAPAAAVKSLEEAAEVLAEASSRAGLPDRIEVVHDGAPEAPADELRQKVEADESVKRVLEIFGGRIERIEEHS